MKIIVWIICLSIAASVYGDETTRAFNAARLRDLRSVAFDRVTSVRVSKISSPEEGATVTNASFHGYIANTPCREVLLEEAEPLVRVLRRTIEFWVDAYAKAGNEDVVELSSFCMPRPGYGIQLQTKSGSRDFAVCLECGEMYVFGTREASVVLHLGEQQKAVLRNCYSAELR